MANPGAASTQTVNYLLNGSASDGVQVGAVSGKVGFYGITPVVRAGAITALTASPSTAETVAAVNAIITAIKNIGVTS
jgi:hypothetical protein